MKAFWWFKENLIAGMARPGFNSTHWFDLPFAEAAMMGWIGQYPTGVASLESFQEHLHISLSEEHLAKEIRFLKDQGIQRLVSLTEKQHTRDILEEHFSLHHIGIEDLNAPHREQVCELADILGSSLKNREKMAVHCLAGIGRTSTMLMAAHMVLGEKFEDLQSLLAKQNPSFILTGSQGDFIQTFRKSVAKTQVVAAVIRQNSRFLLGKRSLDKQSAPGRWSLIAGRIETGETEAEAVVRECFEEVGLTVKAQKKVAEFDTDSGATQLHWWLVEIIDGQPYLKNDEHTDLHWFTVDELTKENGFSAEDIVVFRKLGSQ